MDAIGQFTGPIVVDVSRERYAVSRAVWAIPTHEAGIFDVAIEVTGPCLHKRIVVQIPRVRGVEQNGALGRVDHAVQRRVPNEERWLVLQRKNAVDETVLIEDSAGGVRNAVVATINLHQVVARCTGVGPTLANEIWQVNITKIVGRFLQ